LNAFRIWRIIADVARALQYEADLFRFTRILALKPRNIEYIMQLAMMRRSLEQCELDSLESGDGSGRPGKGLSAVDVSSGGCNEFGYTNYELEKMKS
jgi:hypothetical protein